MSATTKSRSVSSIQSVTAGLLALAACFQSGCGASDEPLPATYEVTGSVLAADGQPMPGGMVEFRSTAGESFSAIGRIQPDGTLSLTTMVNGKKLPGAVAGRHQVIVMPPLPDNPQALSPEDVARVLSASGWKPVTVEMVRDDIDDGAPVNADGTISLIVYAAWIVREMGRAD
jgi:hypothetical protein